MGIEYLQSTTRRVPLKVYLSSDHVSVATGKTVSVVISKNGAAFANPSAGATNATEIASGWYYVDLSTTDTATLGPIIVRGTAASCDDSEERADVVKATNRGATGIPDAAANANGGLPILSVSGTTLGYTVTTLTTNNDKTGYGLSSGERSTLATVILSDVTDTLGLDIVSILAGTNALTSRLTAGRATNLDFLTATPPTSAAIADAVWDEVLADHLTSGATGSALNAAGAAGDPWSTAIPGAYGAGTAGHRLGNVPDIVAGGAGGLLIAGVNATASGIVLDLTQALGAARSLDSIADTSLTLNDAFHCAVAGATGRELVSGTTYIIKTPSTGTVLRTFTLDSATAPTSRT